MNLLESPAESVTYYDRPLLKSPVWIWSVPLYFFVGGVAGAAMTLGLAVQILGGRRLRKFSETCHWTGAIGGGIGSVLLISDLGRKARFLAMLRVFRPTSPMSVGSWVLALATPLSAGSALLTSGRGPVRTAGLAAGIGAGVLGMPLATYTAVLLGNSAVPVWMATRKSLPLLFGASSAAGLAIGFRSNAVGESRTRRGTEFWNRRALSGLSCHPCRGERCLRKSTRWTSAVPRRLGCFVEIREDSHGGQSRAVARPRQKRHTPANGRSVWSFRQSRTALRDNSRGQSLGARPLGYFFAAGVTPVSPASPSASISSPLRMASPKSVSSWSISSSSSSVRSSRSNACCWPNISASAQTVR